MKISRDEFFEAAERLRITSVVAIHQEANLTRQSILQIAEKTKVPKPAGKTARESQKQAGPATSQAKSTGDKGSYLGGALENAIRSSWFNYNKHPQIVPMSEDLFYSIARQLNSAKITIITDHALSAGLAKPAPFRRQAIGNHKSRNQSDPAPQNTTEADEGATERNGRHPQASPRQRAISSVVENQFIVPYTPEPPDHWPQRSGRNTLYDSIPAGAAESTSTERQSSHSVQSYSARLPLRQTQSHIAEVADDSDSSPKPPRKKSKKVKKEKDLEEENEATPRKKKSKKSKQSAEESRAERDAEIREKFRLRDEIEQAEKETELQAHIAAATARYEAQKEAEAQEKKNKRAEELRRLCLDSALDLRDPVPSLEDMIHKPLEVGPVYHLVDDAEKLDAAVVMLGDYEYRMRRVIIIVATTLTSLKKVDGMSRLKETQQAIGEDANEFMEEAGKLKENLEELSYYSGNTSLSAEDEKKNKEDKRQQNEQAKKRFQEEVEARAHDDE